MKKVNDNTGKGTGGDRCKLADVLPLRTPFAIDVFPIYACNFTCKYCVYSLPRDKRAFQSDVINMPLEKFEKVIEDAKRFEDKIKIVRFVGVGEPLLHPDICKMVKCVHKSGISNRIEIITNGSKLSKNMVDNLVDSGLTQIRISLQGLSSEDYFRTSGIRIDFDIFLSQLEYMYKNKGDMRIDLKIPSFFVQTKEDNKRFKELFAPYTDSYSFENIVPGNQGVDFEDYTLQSKDGSVYNLRNGEMKGNIDICSFPFYLMMIDPDGSIVPCCSLDNPPKMGNAFKDNIVNIWNGKAFNNFRYRMLSSGAHACGAGCNSCNAFVYNMFPEDIITKLDAARLLDCFK